MHKEFLRLRHLQGTAEFHLEIAPRLRRVTHLRFEEAVATATLMFGTVKGEIGVAQKQIACSAIGWEERDADRRAHDNPMAVEVEGLGDRLHKAFGDARSVGRCICGHIEGRRRHHRELIAAEPRYEVPTIPRRANAVADPTHNCLQQCVAGRVA